MPQEYVLCCSEAPCGDPRDLRRVIPVTASMPYAGITAAPDDAGRGLPNRVAKAPCRPSERQGFVPTALQGVEAERLHPRVVRRPQQTAPRSAPLPTPNAPHGLPRPGRGAACGRGTGPRSRRLRSARGRPIRHDPGGPGRPAPGRCGEDDRSPSPVYPQGVHDAPGRRGVRHGRRWNGGAARGTRWRGPRARGGGPLLGSAHTLTGMPSQPMTKHPS
jgi:hypothetical protein